MFGDKWRSTYEERIFLGDNGYWKYATADGSFWDYAYLSQTNRQQTFGSGIPGVNTKLISGASYWTIKYEDGSQRQFDNTSGSLIAIIDRNGNTTTLTYDAANRLVTVTDAASRHLYFNYPDNNTRLVSSVTSDVGITVSYQYDGDKLVKVTKQDGSVITFEYLPIDPFTNSNLNVGPVITAVKDAEGKILESHTYDWGGRGTSSSRANGVEAVTINYPQSPAPQQ